MEPPEENYGKKCELNCLSRQNGIICLHRILVSVVEKKQFFET